MPITPDSEALGLFRKLRQAAHDAHHASVEASIHAAVHGPIRTPENPRGLTFLFKDAQPGSAEFTRAHLVGSSAPEPIIERLDGIGREDFGTVELLDGRTGEPIARVNRHMRRRLEER
jgi:hypothetical protein